MERLFQSVIGGARGDWVSGRRREGADVRERGRGRWHVGRGDADDRGVRGAGRARSGAPHAHEAARLHQKARRFQQ